MSAFLAGVRAQKSIAALALAHYSDKRQQVRGQGKREEKTLTAFFVFYIGMFERQAESPVFQVSETFFAFKSPTVFSDNLLAFSVFARRTNKSPP